MKSSQIIVLLSLVFATSLAWADKPEEKEAGAQKQDISAKLAGAWVLAGTPEDDAKPAANARKLFVGKGHWVISEADETGKVVFHHGGTFTLDGQKFEEKIDFATEPTANLIGMKFRFKLSLKDNDTLIKEGDGNPFRERWIRLTEK